MYHTQNTDKYSPLINLDTMYVGGLVGFHHSKSRLNTTYYLMGQVTYSHPMQLNRVHVSLIAGQATTSSTKLPCRWIGC